MKGSSHEKTLGPNKPPDSRISDMHTQLRAHPFVCFFDRVELVGLEGRNQLLLGRIREGDAAQRTLHGQELVSWGTRFQFLQLRRTFHFL